MPANLRFRLTLAVVAMTTLSGCGQSIPPARADLTPRPTSAAAVATGATIRAWTTSSPLADRAGHRIAGAQRYILIQIHPHCTGTPGVLDCGGIYTFGLVYTASGADRRQLRCVQRDVPSFQFLGGHYNRVKCNDRSPSRLTAAGVARMSARTTSGWIDADPPVGAFDSVLRFTVDERGRQRYEWSGNAAARCVGTVPLRGPGRGVACAWS